LFLTEQTAIALDRAEAEANLRKAGIENLESCPFCPFAMEYPPVDEHREFKCQHPECLEVSCRLCREKTHIPKTCEEYRREQGISVRNQVDEAMSRALIRNCNKCKTPFIKEEGCNKMTCTQGGCRNVQCYICSASCGYEHFNDKTRGGKDGNCPLFDADIQVRHENEVIEAQKAAMAEVLAEHPEYTEEDLKLHVSDRVKADEEARKKTKNVAVGPNANMVDFQAQVRAEQMFAHPRAHRDGVADRAAVNALANRPGELDRGHAAPHHQPYADLRPAPVRPPRRPARLGARQAAQQPVDHDGDAIARPIGLAGVERARGGNFLKRLGIGRGRDGK
jgi:hypothetical protein